MMLRRKFITFVAGAAAAWPLAARAQRRAAMPVIGFLSGRSPESDAALLAVFLKTLREAGFDEGKNISIEFRWARADMNRLPELAADLVRRKVAVIVANG